MLTRREVTLLLFAFTVFVVAYNFESSVRRFSPSAVVGLSASALLGVENVFRKDGRRVAQYVDRLEQDILGEWEIEQRPVHALGPHGSTEGQQQKSWRLGDVPMTDLIAHVPGFTILDNVFLWNGTVYLTSDYSTLIFPKLETMISTGLDSPYPPVKQSLKFLTRQQVIEMFGYSTHRMSGASVMCFDHPAGIDNYTFIALHRAYSTLAVDPSPLPPPDRIIFANADKLVVNTTGYEIKLTRAAMPFVGHLFSEDWADLATMRPIFLDRVLLADRVAAERGAQAFEFSTVNVRVPPSTSKAKHTAKPKERVPMTIEATDKRVAFAPAFAFPVPTDWFAPVRRSLLDFLAIPDEPRRRAVTYVSTQSRQTGPRLRDADHAMLIGELRKLGHAQGWDVHVVELGGAQIPGTEWEWFDHVRAAARSTVMLSVYGNSLANSVFMRPSSPASTVIEFFPDGKFTNENEFITRSLGIDYIAWRNTKKYSRDSLPPISPPSSLDSRVLNIDVKAVVQFVKEQLKRS